MCSISLHRTVLCTLLFLLLKMPPDEVPSNSSNHKNPSNHSHDDRPSRWSGISIRVWINPLHTGGPLNSTGLVCFKKDYSASDIDCFSDVWLWVVVIAPHKHFPPLISSAIITNEYLNLVEFALWTVESEGDFDRYIKALRLLIGSEVEVRLCWVPILIYFGDARYITVKRVNLTHRD